ncbi:polysaccharide deacetylase [Colletotrichum higginsianum]|uniref:Polysaccharide deacetylase n=2 Tax=Colletotrichum higginsianum TaxID=80884 RepID=H1VRB2_COLHI|nr:Polysaccharide deacetylase [Colletotrichum higginsianum IMI 349063]OBR08259.1 Polysaccharide deacetylase [Colletotrichum higginsianum IMI 349063]TIC89509.1 Chitin deacetylase [Colletotrichum higginsianum]GJC97664.1 polysaccharide deacetylase [Colletotrichum higginsianum]CCF42768.1 polysaccharide deacetylase [Colletotrichum higginsianum]
MHFAAVVTSLLVVGAAAGPFRRQFTSNKFSNNTSLALPTRIPYGTVIDSCTVKDTFALTFDDGPFTYTNHVLDLLAEAQVRATFFVTGSLLSDIREQKAVIQRMLDEGHQVGHHTWSHADLATTSDKDVVTQMTKLEDAFFDIIGKCPTYMRPPYFSWNSATLSIMKDLKYHVIRADIDTFDWKYSSYGNLTGLTLFENGIDAGGTLTLCHDVQKNTAEVLLPELLRVMKENNLNGVPVGECLGDPEANWYRTERIVPVQGLAPLPHGTGSI